MQQPPLKDRAQGRWRGILPLLGIAESFLNGKHGPCPLCRGGRDRFRFDDKEGRGTWICSQCGAGDGIELVKRHIGMDFKAAADRIEEVVGPIPKEVAKPAQTPRQKRDAMNRTWLDGLPIAAGDPVHLHLEARCGLLDAIPRCLRMAPRLRYQDDEPSWHPAMLAKVTDAAGLPVNVHRTYLTKDGRKADVPKPKRLMSGELPPGCAVRLAAHESRLGIAEGIETAISASKLWDVPCWAALNEGRLAVWMPPPGVTEVIVFGDNDENHVGQAAAYSLARRLSSKHLAVEVMIPDRAGDDWNDVHREQMAKLQQERAA